MNANSRIFAIAGSFRRNASGVSILKGAAAIVPAGIGFRTYDALAKIPPFNDSNDAPIAVRDFQKKFPLPMAFLSVRLNMFSACPAF
jgi:hypothetical protein